MMVSILLSDASSSVSSTTLATSAAFTTATAFATTGALLTAEAFAINGVVAATGVPSAARTSSSLSRKAFEMRNATRGTTAIALNGMEATVSRGPLASMAALIAMLLATP